MSKLKLIKANIKIWYFKKEEKKPFNKKMKGYLKWHLPFKKGNYCSYCGSYDFKNNDEGFYRCRICGERFIILRATDEDKFIKETLQELIKKYKHILFVELYDISKYDDGISNIKFKRCYFASNRILDFYEGENNILSREYNISGNKVKVREKKLNIKLIKIVNYTPIFEILGE